ncbi:hypothetical protein [Tsuneonella sp. HG222]
MRAALIATDDAAFEPEREPARLGGRAVSLHQLDFALGQGCGKILCLGHGASPEAIALRHAAEAAGAQFQVLRGPRDLPAAVRGEDELLVFTRGLLPDSLVAFDLLRRGPVILSLPVRPGAGAGFELLDLTTAWGGAMKIPGRFAAAMDMLPDDGDAVSGLLRIARQAGVPEKELPEAELAEGRWVLLRTAEQGVAAESGWLRRRLPAVSPWRPTAWLARTLLRRFGSASTDRSHLKSGAKAVAGLAIAGAVAAAWYAAPLAGFALLALALLAIEFGDAAARLERPSFAGEASPSKVSAGLRIALDLALIVVGALAIPGALHRRIFLAILPVALLQLWPGGNRADWRSLATDRMLVIAALALTTAGDGAEKGFMAVTLVLLALRLVARPEPRG